MGIIRSLPQYMAAMAFTPLTAACLHNGLFEDVLIPEALIPEALIADAVNIRACIARL